MAQVRCEVGVGMREGERTVTVRDVHGRRQYLRVEEGFLAQQGNQAFLPVGIVGLDEAKNLALIELPHESDGGVNRLWVRYDELRNQPRESVA
jgi:hypothetical protein